jgi:DNA-binding transcriptional MerR regulator
MSVLITIGDFSRMTHLSVKALRHYHDVGLLEPMDVDPSSGYRLYDVAQVPVAQVIRRFRDLGMPVEEVRSMLTAPDVETRNKVITAHLERMESQLAETAATVTSLKSMLEGPALTAPVDYRHLEATPALVVTSHTDMDGFVPWWMETFSVLRRALEDLELTRSGPDGALYPNEIFEFWEGEVTAFIPVSERRSDLILPAGVSITVIPAAELAVMVHSGNLDDLDQTYGALGTAVATRGLGVDGPIREYYVVSPLDAADQADYRTEVCWPVFRG